MNKLYFVIEKKRKFLNKMYILYGLNDLTLQLSKDLDILVARVQTLEYERYTIKYN